MKNIYLYSTKDIWVYDWCADINLMLVENLLLEEYFADFIKGYQSKDKSKIFLYLFILSLFINNLYYYILKCNYNSLYNLAGID